MEATKILCGLTVRFDGIYLRMCLFRRKVLLWLQKKRISTCKANFSMMTVTASIIQRITGDMDSIGRAPA